MPSEPIPVDQASLHAAAYAAYDVQKVEGMMLFVGIVRVKFDFH